MNQILERVIQKVQSLPDAEQSHWAKEWLQELESSELQNLEQNRAMALSDFLNQLEPDQIAHQQWLETNRKGVRPAKYIIGQTLHQT
jgi:predicted alpha/beta hydrolase family esterase